ncbi:MAG: hypothetical protein V4490_08440, partial [Pseudomonadota bacterium]
MHIRTIRSLALAFLGVLPFSLQCEPEPIEHDLVTYFDAAEPSHQKGYALGQYLAHRLTQLGTNPDQESLYLGLRDGLNQYNRLDPQLCQHLLEDWQTRWRTVQERLAFEQRQERLNKALAFW